jgi:A/G-specific adenine glycosylase
MDFSKKLNLWYQHNKRDFPWRNTRNPYQIWLSEIILQQTQTIQGLPYYLKFVATYPTIFDLAKADETAILKLWQGLGYYSRARNLHFTANYIVDNYNGVFPNSYTSLITLKGIGDYTASAIASICFDEKTAVVDGNVYRVLARFFGIETPINSSLGIKEFKRLAQELMPNKDFGHYNQALMDFGATICTPKKTKCDDCIFNDSCFALQHKKVSELPIKINKTKIRKRYFNYIVITTKQQKTVLQKRENNGIWQNLFEFPLIETSKITAENQLIKSKEFLQLIGKDASYSIALFNSETIVHKLSHQHIFTKFWIVDIDDIKTKSIPIKTINDYPVPTLIHNFIKEFDF